MRWMGTPLGSPLLKVTVIVIAIIMVKITAIPIAIVMVSVGRVSPSAAHQLTTHGTPSPGP
jgi:hypothetical protein